MLNFNQGKWSEVEFEGFRLPYQPTGKGPQTVLGNTPADLGKGAFSTIRGVTPVRREVLGLTPLIPNANAEAIYDDAPPRAGGIAPIEAQSIADLGMGTQAAREGGQTPKKTPIVIMKSGFSLGDLDVMQLALFGLLGVGMFAAVRK